MARGGWSHSGCIVWFQSYSLFIGNDVWAMGCAVDTDENPGLQESGAHLGSKRWKAEDNLGQGANPWQAHHSYTHYLATPVSIFLE